MNKKRNASIYVRDNPGIINTINNRFYAKVLLPNENGCMFFVGGKNKKKLGYGIFYDRNGQKRAHRFSYELFYGSIPKGLEVLHICDTPCCVAPEHLKLGTHKENMEDSKNKGRHFKIAPRYGEDNNMSKLTEKDVLEIRKQLNAGHVKAVIAKRFKITKNNLRSIELRKTWNHI